MLFCLIHEARKKYPSKTLRTIIRKFGYKSWDFARLRRRVNWLGRPDYYTSG